VPVYVQPPVAPAVGGAAGAGAAAAGLRNLAMVRLEGVLRSLPGFGRRGEGSSSSKEEEGSEGGQGGQRRRALDVTQTPAEARAVFGALMGAAAPPLPACASRALFEGAPWRAAAARRTLGVDERAGITAHAHAAPQGEVRAAACASAAAAVLFDGVGGSVGAVVGAAGPRQITQPECATDWSLNHVKVEPALIGTPQGGPDVPENDAVSMVM